MRLLLAGGGTGGHLFPAVALAQRLLQQDETAAVQFVGTKRGLEARMLPKLGLPLETVDMAGVVGRGVRGKLELAPKLLKSLRQAQAVLKQFAPDVVVGVGGYASVPVLLAAKLRGVPYLIHEQNAIPGLSNRLLGRWAKRICLSFPQTPGFDPARAVLTGNPLRTGLEDVSARLPDAGHLLIFGGSRGARAINQIFVKTLPLLRNQGILPSIVHQTGEEDYAQVRQAYSDAGLDPQQVVPFIDDMAAAYGGARLVICRAGATTLAELTACGRPAILIPFPFATSDHQTANARALARDGAAVLLPQDTLSPELLCAKIRELLTERDTLQQMAEKARSQGRPGAADRVLDECRKVVAECHA